MGFNICPLKCMGTLFERTTSDAPKFEMLMQTSIINWDAYI